MPFSEKTIEHKDFGRITIVKSSRARRISLSMKPFQALKLTVPMFVSYKRAEEFLGQKGEWIHKNLEKIRRLEDQYTLFTEETEFRTREHELEIYRRGNEQATFSLRNGKIRVKIPEETRVDDPQVQELIRCGIQAAWRMEANKHLPRRLEELSGEHGLSYNRVFIKNNRSRWGSCSHKNNINLSLHMMRLPEHLIDYILLHELVHTVHKDHSKHFWQDLERVFPSAKAADRELKRYRLDIY